MQLKNVKMLKPVHLVVKHTFNNLLIYFRVHPDYDATSIENDVACLETETEIIFNELTQPIPLINRIVNEGTLMLSGWGRLYEGGPQPTNLQFLETFPVSLNECKEIMPANDDTFCAFSKFS